MINFYGGASAGAVGSALSGVTGNANGFLVMVNGQLVAREFIDTFPLRIQNKDGRAGSPIFGVAPQGIIAATRIDVSLTGDQSFEVVGVEEFTPRRVLFARASAAPSAGLKLGVYTLPGKAGLTLAPDTTSFAGMTGTRSTVEVPVNLGESLETAHFYVTATTPNPTPLTMDVYVLGDVLRLASA